MGWLLRKCERCNKYTLNEDRCRYCGGKVHIPHPARFSPQDKYASIRRAMKIDQMKEGRQYGENVCQGNTEN